MNGYPYKLLVIEERSTKGSSQPWQELRWQDQFQIDLFTDFQQAALSVNRHAYDGVVIVIDLFKPANSRLLSRAAYLFARLPVIVISNVEDPFIEQQVMRLGFQDFLIDGQYQASQLGRSIICAIERKRLIQTYRVNQALGGGINTLQQTEGLLVDLMVTLYSPVKDVLSAVGQVDRLVEHNSTRLQENPVDRVAYLPLLKQSKENLENRYVRYLYIQQHLNKIDKSTHFFMLTPMVDQTMRSFSSTLHFLKARTRMEILCRQWHGSSEVFCEILLQLVSNAIKFRSLRRQFDLQIRIKRLPNGSLKLTIADNGQGIDMRYDKGKIFKLFHQGHQRTPRCGDGAGLYIVKTLVDHYWGNISVNSRINQGTLVSVFLPG